MKTYNLFITGLLAVFAYMAGAQSQQHNYISSFIPTQEITSSAQVNTINSRQTIRYFDGLGRPVETIEVKSSPQGKDRISLAEYDAAGRNYKTWLPIPIQGNNGNYKDPAQLKSMAPDIYNDQKPFNHIEFDESPLNRYGLNYGPGSLWEEWGPDKYSRPRYFPYEGDYLFPRYLAFPYPDKGVCHIGKISEGIFSPRLYINEIWENGVLRQEFSDSRNLLIMQRIYMENEYADTYYVYDIKGNLSAVLPPMAMKLLPNDLSRKAKHFDDIPYGYRRSSDGEKTPSPEIKQASTTYPVEPLEPDPNPQLPDEEIPLYYDLQETWNSEESHMLKEYAYFYLYDERRRCIAKKLPGCDWIYYVYDKKDQLIFTQDGELRKQRK